MDRIKLHRRRLIVLGAALAAAAVCCLVVMRRRDRKYSVQQLAPLCDALIELVSAIRATAPAQLHPDLHPTMMGVPGFTEEQLIVTLMYLVEGRGHGAAFLAMSNPDRALWIKLVLAEK